MRVKSCTASDGAGHVIQLSDEQGCVLRPKMISRFLKARAADERATVITYAFFHAFKFPDALSVHIKCKVEICRHGCLDHCQLRPHQDSSHNGPAERKDQQSKPVPESSVGPEVLLYDEEGDGEHAAAHFPVISTDSRSPSAEAHTQAHKAADEAQEAEAIRRPFQARFRCLVPLSRCPSFAVTILLWTPVCYFYTVSTRNTVS
jgi:hypothetical protein